jgi:hypothetical protein
MLCKNSLHAWPSSSDEPRCIPQQFTQLLCESNDEIRMVSLLIFVANDTNARSTMPADGGIIEFCLCFEYGYTKTTTRTLHAADTIVAMPLEHVPFLRSSVRRQVQRQKRQVK